MVKAKQVATSTSAYEYMSLIVWLEAITFIKLHGHHSSMKPLHILLWCGKIYQQMQ